MKIMPYIEELLVIWSRFNSCYLHHKPNQRSHGIMVRFFYLIIAVLKIAIGFFAQVLQTAGFVISSQLTINIDKER